MTEYHQLQIEVQTPGDPTEITNRCLRNDARKLPDATPIKTCIIISSGPSARHSALWERLRNEPLPTVAVNNALKLCIEHGHTPTYWACCDPQELVTDFIPEFAPRWTTYLVANKCPDSLFDKLAKQKLKTEVWRISDYRTNDRLHVPTASTITLATESLMRFRGFHRFEHYGWDCCYINDEAHSYKQTEPDATKLEFEMRNENNDLLATFPTNSSWIAELQDAVNQTYNLTVMGYEVVVHGPGAVGALLRAKGLIK